MKRITIILFTLVLVGSAKAATFIVTTTNDLVAADGVLSLREAISNANASAGSHLINFAIPPLDGTVKTITPSNALPTISKSVTIDGYTQDTASPNTLTNDDNAVLLIELNGTTAGGGGLSIAVTNCVVRGLVINRFALNGIFVSAPDTLIEGNFIGTDPTGTIKRPNGAGLGIGAANSIVGGTTPAARNLISGNSNIGLNTGGGGSTNIVIEGNFIGTDVHGTAALGNGGSGVSIVTATKTIVGGTAVGAGNVISGNGLNGVAVGTDGNVMQGNFIGTDLTGTLNLSNHTAGVALSSASGNTIGGAVGNLIAFNGGAGVSVSQGVPHNTNNLISANTIFSNGALGIDLDVAGVTTNDVTDADTGANQLQNFPVLSVATNITGGVQIQGFLNSTANTTFTLEFFANAACDPSGFGEGETFIGTTNVTSAANGTNNFTIVFTNSVPDGQFITATATDPDNNTSEFSACRQIAGAAPIIVDCSLLPGLATNTVSTAHIVSATVTTNSNPASGVLVNFSVTAGPNLGQAGTATTSVGGQGSFTYTGSVTPGTDTIRALGMVAGQSFTCTATKVWISTPNQPPVANCRSVTTNANASCQAVLVAANFDNGSFDNDGTITGRSINPTGPFAKGVTQVILTVTDNDGASDTCTTTVTVVDNTLPLITCHSDITSNVAAGVTNSVVHFGAPTVSDNCAIASTNCAPASGSVFPLGTNTVTCMAVDTAGNTNTCNFKIIVTAAAPNIPPIAQCSNVTVSANGSCQAAVAATAVDAGSFDPDGSIANRTLNPPGPYAKGTNQVVLTVTDNQGASATCTANVIVVDTTLPTIACHATITTNVAAGISNAVVTFSAPTASDNCGIASTNCSPASGSTFALGTNTVTCTAIDTSGNTNTCSFSVIVLATPPETHDLAVIRLHVPPNINLKAAGPALTKRVTVQIQNLSLHDETITGAVLSNGLVSVTLSNLHTSCTPPAAVLIGGPPNVVPKTLKPNGKLNVFFNVTFGTNCVPDAAKGPNDEDFSYTAAVNHAALDGNADTVPSNDTCPRPPNPSISDKGCGNKDAVTKQLGAPVQTDVVLKP